MGLDRWVDRQITGLRGNALIDPIMYGASWFGDDGRGWIAISAVRARTSSTPLRAFLRQMAWLGIESGLVNGPAKALVRRPRPLGDGVVHRHHLRRPTQSSFPSGHAASAGTMAVLLSEEGLAPLWWTIAVTVGVSRIYVGVHHTSDVAAGLAVGAGFGLLARHIRLPIVDHRPPAYGT